MAAGFICLNCFSIFRLGKKSREVPKRYLLFLPKILSFEAPVLIVESDTEQVDQTGGSDTGQARQIQNRLGINKIYGERRRDLWNSGRD